MNTVITYPDVSWRALTYFNIYRFIIAFLFVSLVWIGQLPEPLGEHDNFLFAVASHAYLFSSIFFAFLIKNRHPRYNLQIALQVLFDIIGISLMMYASGGLNSGFGMLLVIAVAGGSILRAGKIAILFAAIASIVVLCQEMYFEFVLYSIYTNYIHAGFLGVTFFVTAILGHILANYVQQTEALAKQRAIDLENLSLLNDYIIQGMQSGVIVLDEENKIRMLNESAKRLLGIQKDVDYKNIDSIAHSLGNNLKLWLEDMDNSTIIFRPEKGNMDVRASFAKLTPESDYGILIFLEDVSSLQQQAQKLKINSLGRLAASIAHEVRNPLGAISHASQLLSESPSLGPEDIHLTEIISQHSRRVNTIIENTLKISRREPSVVQHINMSEWLGSFVKEFIRQNQLSPKDIEYIVVPSNMKIKFDPDQLRQIVLNISENALRYSKNKPMIKLVCESDNGLKQANLDIWDLGGGISEDKVEHLFEPFFTTEVTGSGLGLYIARELCEANQASIELHENSNKGCCFRIHFPQYIVDVN